MQHYLIIKTNTIKTNTIIKLFYEIIHREKMVYEISL